MSALTTSANRRSPKLPDAQWRTPSLTCIPREMRQVLHVDVGRQLAIGLSLREQVAEHVGVDVGALGAGQYPMFVPVALEDRLDDQIARVAGHRPFEAAQRLDDHGLDLVVGAGSSIERTVFCAARVDSRPTSNNTSSLAGK